MEKKEETWTVLQLQSTYNGDLSGIMDGKIPGSIKGIATLSDASSPLLSTKAKFDFATYDWLSSNAASKCGGKLLVCKRLCR
ncbi:MAG: hypothetical protein HC930_12445 [Hydrococcus sp. SU_1_0]|nr:hypothetical protein [Hydrococcus sp. SU_1_0]